MRQTKKGNPWYFGVKAHIGTDTQGLTHSLVATDAAQSDYNELPNLIHGEADEIHADSAYRSDADRRCFQEVKVRYRVNRRGQRNRPLSDRAKVINREYSRVRSRVEHPFHVVKRVRGLSKVRYRGLAKNTARAYAAFALANLYLARKRLAPLGA